MVDATATRMDGIAISEFLGRQGTGVLSLAADDQGYAIPVSYAFDDEGGHAFYFRLGYGPNSEKRTFVEAAEEATFVVYEQTPAGWTSVVARGPLEALSSSSLESSIVESVKDLDIPYFRVHDRAAEDLEFHVVELDVAELTGVREG